MHTATIIRPYGAPATIMVHRACESLHEGVVAASLYTGALGTLQGPEPTDAAYQGAEQHALSAVRLLLRLLRGHPSNAAVTKQAGGVAGLVWLASRGSLPARQLATEALCSWAACIGGAGPEELVPVLSAAARNAAVADTYPPDPMAQELRLLSLELLGAAVGPDGRHVAEMLSVGAHRIACDIMRGFCQQLWGESGNACPDTAVALAVSLLSRMATSADVGARTELLRTGSVRWLFHVAQRGTALHNSAAAVGALAVLLLPLHVADCTQPAGEVGERVDVDYRGLGWFYPSRIEAVREVEEREPQRSSRSHHRRWRRQPITPPGPEPEPSPSSSCPCSSSCSSSCPCSCSCSSSCSCSCSCSELLQLESSEPPPSAVPVPAETAVTTWAIDIRYDCDGSVERDIR